MEAIDWNQSFERFVRETCQECILWQECHHWRHVCREVCLNGLCHLRQPSLRACTHPHPFSGIQDCPSNSSQRFDPRYHQEFYGRQTTGSWGISMHTCTQNVLFPTSVSSKHLVMSATYNNYQSNQAESAHMSTEYMMQCIKAEIWVTQCDIWR